MGSAYDIGAVHRRRFLRGYLLDTNIALAGMFDPRRISRRISRAVEAGPCYISTISYWEVMLKCMKGNLDVGNPAEWWAETIDSLALVPLAFRAEHVAAIRHMPPLHSDPFDRALLAVARAEGLALLTLDKQMAEYASDQLQVIL